MTRRVAGHPRPGQTRISVRKRSRWAVLVDVLKKPSVLLVTGLLGIVVAFNKNLVLGLLEQNIDTPAVVDRLSTAEMIRTSVHAWGPGETIDNLYAMRSPWNVTDGELATMNSRNRSSADAAAYYALLKQKGAIKVGSLDISLNLEGRSAEEVRIDDVTAVEIQRETPVSGNFVCDPSAGGGNLERMHFELDETRPLARIDKDDGSVGPPYFASRTITLKPRELATLHITASTTRSDVRFKLAISMTAGTHHEILTIGENGRPFEVTAPAGGGLATVSSVRHYRTMYILETGEPAVRVPDPASFTGLYPGTSDSAC